MRALSIVFFVMAALHAAPCGAQSSPDARARAAARDLFERGVACVDRSDWACAVDAFGRARALHPSAVILTNYAVALEHVGRLVEASEAYRQILRDPSANARARATAERGLHDIEPLLGHLTVRVRGGTAGAVVSMDGTPLAHAAWGIAVPVDPGTHRLEVHRGATRVASADVEVARGASATTELDVPAAVVDPATVRASADVTAETQALGASGADALAGPGETPAEHHEVTEEWWFWTLLGVVVVGAGVGTAVAVVESQPAQGPMGTLGTIDVRP